MTDQFNEQALGPQVPVPDTLFAWAVSKTNPAGYGRWWGQLTLSFQGRPFLSVDASLIDGRNGEFISFPRRKYEANGEAKYANQIYFVDRGQGDTALAAVLQFLGGDASTAPDLEEPPL